MLQTILTIDEITHIMQELQDCLAYDVHCTCSEAQAAVQSIQAEHRSRPSSVASVHLSDPDIFTRRPQAKMTDHVDEWSD